MDNLNELKLVEITDTDAEIICTCNMAAEVQKPQYTEDML